MAMIVTHEWYLEHGKKQGEGALKLTRDYARDAAVVDAADEIIYE